MRWFERPMRCMMREAPFGAPTLTTRSTSPQSTPRSSVEVHTTALSLPSPIAASTRRRCPTSSEPWWRAIASPSSLRSQSAWNTASACMRVLTKTSVVLCCADEAVDRRHRLHGEVARHRQRLVDREHVDVGPRAALDDEEIGHLPSPLAGRADRRSRAGWGSPAASARRKRSLLAASRRCRLAPCPAPRPLPARGRGFEPCGTRYRRSSSGSRTVAERPVAVSPGASR